MAKRLDPAPDQSPAVEAQGSGDQVVKKHESFAHGFAHGAPVGSLNSFFASAPQENEFESGTDPAPKRSYRRQRSVLVKSGR